MKKTLTICAIAVVIMLSGSVSMAQYRGGGHYGGGEHYGYYHNARGDWVFGLLGLGVIAAVEANRPVYVQQPYVYQTPPQVVYMQPPVVYQAPPAPVAEPTVVYQAPPVPVAPPPMACQAPPVVQQPAMAQQPVPVTCTVSVTNSNGSYTPVTLLQEGTKWVGPRGEYYDKMPTMEQLRPVYAF